MMVEIDGDDGKDRNSATIGIYDWRGCMTVENPRRCFWRSGGRVVSDLFSASASCGASASSYYAEGWQRQDSPCIRRRSYNGDGESAPLAMVVGAALALIWSRQRWVGVNDCDGMQVSGGATMRATGGGSWT
ncbi:unnamed protein product [Linum trigynum]|uniref:Uncharacterized protein n=1 Tax=Linum trigynum TaxID=586398 RepID=A0AAV2G617_9ROSI